MRRESVFFTIFAHIYETIPTHPLRAAALGCGIVQPQHGLLAGGGRSRTPARHPIRHHRRRLPPRRERSGPGRDHGQDSQPLRHLGRRHRPAGQGGREDLPLTQHPRRPEVCGLHPRGFALRAPSGLPGLRAQSVGLRGLRVHGRLGSRPHGRKGVHHATLEEERRHHLLALGLHHGEEPPLRAGRRAGGHLPVDGRLLRHPEG